MDESKQSRRASSAKSEVPRAQLEKLVADLKIHQEELNAQQAQLIDSHRALQSARDRYAELFDFAPIGYLTLDSSGMIREANLAAESTLGADRGALIGRPLFLHVTEIDRRSVLDHVARCRRGQRHVETEVTVRRAGSGFVPVRLTSAPVQHTNGVVFLTALVDLSESKRLEEERSRIREVQSRLHHDEQLARAASDAKDRFLAMLSHELRTPLTPILLALDTIRQRAPMDETLESTLSMIHRNVVLETRLIDDLLDVSRIIQGKMTFVPEVTDLHVLANEVIEMLDADLAKSEVAISVDLRAAAHHVKGDPVRLRQVLWNVLHNSVRNTPAKGKVAVKTANDITNKITLTIEDSGCGISPALLPRIFKFFEQGEELRQRGIGLGLGLPISKAIVDAHGGFMTVSSDGRDHGTCVRVDLPIVAAPAAAPVAIDRKREPQRTRRILLVEDNEDSATALAEILSMHGYEVRIARSVHEALGFVDDVDIVVSDIGLPDGTGHELMRAITERRPLPGIALSGYGTKEDMRRSTEAGFDHHIVKPVEPQRLLDVLASLTDSATSP